MYCHCTLQWPLLVSLFYTIYRTCQTLSDSLDRLRTDIKKMLLIVSECNNFSEDSSLTVSNYGLLFCS